MYDLDDEQLVTSLREAAGQLTKHRGNRAVETTVTNLMYAAVATIPRVAGGGISRTEHGTVRSTHATDEQIYALDQLQSELGQGPCITAADDLPVAGVVTANDWPAPARSAGRSSRRAVCRPVTAR